MLSKCSPKELIGLLVLVCKHRQVDPKPKSVRRTICINLLPLPLVYLSTIAPGPIFVSWLVLVPQIVPQIFALLYTNPVMFPILMSVLLCNLLTICRFLLTSILSILLFVLSIVYVLPSRFFTSTGVSVFALIIFALMILVFLLRLSCFFFFLDFVFILPFFLFSSLSSLVSPCAFPPRLNTLGRHYLTSFHIPEAETGGSETFELYWIVFNGCAAKSPSKTTDFSWILSLHLPRGLLHRRVFERK